MSQKRILKQEDKRKIMLQLRYLKATNERKRLIAKSQNVSACSDYLCRLKILSETYYLEVEKIKVGLGSFIVNIVSFKKNLSFKKLEKILNALDIYFEE